ncbi:MarR family transcriptional regulator [Bacillus luteolus]|uniref:MarR family transcriptional regulator n=1 Tax=Litchfieldia luteola TaxID=682179 RepID=A0ABR9QQ57_9BACI|nr:MarR family transcriptional regulator [Cytobacillus luteolus]MBE4910531.1 MarR family transcriptional regulator [Cytobacillus luteolus]MBP1943708.1 MarR family transcriptional regulator [Cytobacillus luteolus]
MNDFLTLEKQLCFAVYETAGEFTRLYTSILQPFNLTYPQYLVLVALWEQDGLTVKELGEKLGLGTGTLTPMLTRMEGHGWLNKVRSTLDERKVLVHLQTKANEQKSAITETISKEIEACRIELEEYEQLMENLNKLHKKLRERN